MQRWWQKSANAHLTRVCTINTIITAVNTDYWWLGNEYASSQFWFVAVLTAPLFFSETVVASKAPGLTLVGTLPGTLSAAIALFVFGLLTFGGPPCCTTEFFLSQTAEAESMMRRARERERDSVEEKKEAESER